jgi:hypothetical protein
VHRPTFFSFACAWAQHSTSSPFTSLPLSLSRCIEISVFILSSLHLHLGSKWIQFHSAFLLAQNGCGDGVGGCRLSMMFN